MASTTRPIKGLPFVSPMPVMPSSVSTSTTAVVSPQSRPKRQVSGGINGTDTTCVLTSVTFMTVPSLRRQRPGEGPPSPR